jgi:hypothetical protein
MHTRSGFPASEALGLSPMPELRMQGGRGDVQLTADEQHDGGGRAAQDVRTLNRLGGT